jgi:hypothetical protein
MAVTHPTPSVRNGIADYVVDQLDGGTLEFQTSGAGEVATLTFGTPAFGAATGGTATANAITSDTDASGGTIAQAVLRSSGATVIVACDVGTTGSDINLSSVAIGAGDTVEITGLTYAAPV